MMELVDDDGMHPIIGTSKCTMAIIYTKQREFEKARQCLRDATSQFERIHDELITEGHWTEELIGIRNDVTFFYSICDMRCETTEGLTHKEKDSRTA